MSEQGAEMTDEYGKEFWDSTYQDGEYLNHWDYAYPSQELVALVAAQVPKDGAVCLDVGCGAGRDAVFLAQCGFQVIGVDISDKALVIAEKRAAEAGVNVDWRCGSFLDLPLEDHSVDFINDRGALHLVVEPDRPRFASELRRVLKPGGIMLVRGASEANVEEHFTPITVQAVDRHFSSSTFSRGPVAPITLVSDGGNLPANIVVLRKLNG